jgi:hypothetical protein
MTALIRPLGEVLARCPAADSGEDGTAGFCFEQYQPFRVATQPAARRDLVLEALADTNSRLLDASRLLAGLPNGAGAARVAAAARNTNLIRDALADAWEAH